MKYDLLLTGTGDLSFMSSNTKFKNEMLELNFHIAPTDSLCLNFNIDGTNENIEFPNKKSKPSRIDLELDKEEDIPYIEFPKIGNRVFIKESNKLFEIKEVHSIMPIDDEEIEDFKPQDSIISCKQLNYMFSDNLQLNFYTYTPSFDKTSRVVKGRDYVQQSIKLRLSTELNTVLHNETLGSTLHEYVHSNLDASRLLSYITQQVKKSISDILPNCEVSAYIINSDYLNYHDSIKIVIVNNEEVYYYYI